MNIEVLNQDQQRILLTEVMILHTETFGPVGDYKKSLERMIQLVSELTDMIVLLRQVNLQDKPKQTLTIGGNLPFDRLPETLWKKMHE